MPNNLIMRQITLTGAAQSLGGDEVFSVDVSCPPTNTAVVYFKVGSASEIPWQAGQWHNLKRIRLADISVRGAAGDTVILVGGTW
jgi:hypothetical protein